MEKTNVIIILEVFANYRIDFFKNLNEKLKQENKTLIIIAGKNVRSKVIKEIDKIGLTIEYTKTRKIYLFSYKLKWQKGLQFFIRKHNPSTVILHYNAGNINYNILLLHLMLIKTPYILWGCGWERPDLKGLKLKIKNKLKRFFINKSHGYITYDTHFKNRLVLEGYPNKRITVAQNTINIEKIISHTNNFKKDYKIINFLFVGALTPLKQIDNAIEVFNKINKKGLKFSFTIVGEGTEKNNLIKMINNYNLTDRIHIEGEKYGYDLKNIFEKSNVFVMPGVGGLAVNEAMSYSLPIISTPGDGTIYDLIENGINGFLIDKEYKLKDLEEKIVFFILSNNTIIKEMEKESLRIIQDKALLANQVNQFIRAINLRC